MSIWLWNHNFDGRAVEKALSRLGLRTCPHDGPLISPTDSRASGEVCPKHRNSRRENLRVRPANGGKGFVLFVPVPLAGRPASHHAVRARRFSTLALGPFIP
jgi:hypothetical protein